MIFLYLYVVMCVPYSFMHLFMVLDIQVARVYKLAEKAL